jgi:hypothetical protein
MTGVERETPTLSVDPGKVLFFGFSEYSAEQRLERASDSARSHPAFAVAD